MADMEQYLYLEELTRMNKSNMLWQSYLNLEKEAINLSKYIYFTDEYIDLKNKKTESQLYTFSPYIADLLVECCVQIEAISKELYFENGGDKERGNTFIRFDEDCLKLIDKKWNTHEKEVNVIASSFNLVKDENRILRLLKEAHKRKGTYWEKAYQAVKHDRYNSLPYGNIRAFLRALAALYLLNIYYRNEILIVKYSDIHNMDFSMGSEIFSVNPPHVNQLWEGNIPTTSTSPYVAKYLDEEYERIKKIRMSEKEQTYKYWVAQPELNENQFAEILNDLKKNNRYDMCTCMQELAKYRLHRRIPDNLSFSDKKKRLIYSEEWDGIIHLKNKHIIESELTEENIEDAINEVGDFWGMELMNSTQRLDWLPIAFNENICKVYIPDESLLSTEDL